MNRSPAIICLAAPHARIRTSPTRPFPLRLDVNPTTRRATCQNPHESNPSPSRSAITTHRRKHNTSMQGSDLALGRHGFQRLRRNSRMRASPWKSGPLEPRKLPAMCAGFSPGGRLSSSDGVFPQPLPAVPQSPPNTRALAPENDRCTWYSSARIKLRESVDRSPAN